VTTRLTVDDQITVVTPATTLCLIVETVARNSFTCRGDDFLSDVEGWKFTNGAEGIHWIRGWHTPDSEEVKAARVAQGIGNDKKRTKRVPYRELEAQAKRNAEEADIARRQVVEVRKVLDEMRRAQSGVSDAPSPNNNESWSDAAWRKLRGG
jgi:transposase